MSTKHTPVKTYLIDICDDCYEMVGDTCNNPECAFCRQGMGTIEDVLVATSIRPIVNAERLRLGVTIDRAKALSAPAMFEALKALTNQIEAQFSYHRDEYGQDVPADEVTYYLAPIFEPLIREAKVVLAQAEPAEALRLAGEEV